MNFTRLFKSSISRFGNVALLILITSSLLMGCEHKANKKKPVPLTTEQKIFNEARELLPNYYNFIKTMKSQGYVFWSFTKYSQADKSRLPKKLLVVRHDIHVRDLELTYYVWVIERALLNQPDCSTYFVMWGNPREDNDPAIQKEDLKLISFLKQRGCDVQPHISPIDMYVDQENPWWTNRDTTELRALYNKNYEMKKFHDGIEFKVIGSDVFKLKEYNEKLKSILKDYNRKWETATGLKPVFYAAHGSKTPMNHIFQNQVVLDQRCLLKSGIYKFDTYNTSIFNNLTYLSDNKLPSWMANPSEVKPGRYQFLAHPRQWLNEAYIPSR